MFSWKIPKNKHLERKNIPEIEKIGSATFTLIFGFWAVGKRDEPNQIQILDSCYFSSTNLNLINFLLEMSNEEEKSRSNTTSTRFRPVISAYSPRFNFPFTFTFSLQPNA